MRKKPIYVEIQMTAPIDTVWQYTQDPHYHEQWDLRFTSITYTPKENEDAPQLFTYETKVMPGLKVAGWGESKGTHNKNDGTKTSSLHFGTDQKISPICEGKGYWQYVPKENELTFLTQYDYDVRYGKLGQLLDVIFRPVMGWATALSFDVLRRWIEKGESPSWQYRRFFIAHITSLLFFFVWFYQGLLPKVLVQHPGEIELFSALTGIEGQNAILAVFSIGILEILFAITWLFPWQKRRLFALQILLFPLLTLSAIMADLSIASAPFNPITLNITLWCMSLIGYITSKDLPTAKSCKRKRSVSA